MKRILSHIVLGLVAVTIMFIIYDFLFLNIEIEIEDINIDKPYLNSLASYEVLEEFSNKILTIDDVNALYITLRIHNKSFLKTYKLLEAQFSDDINLYPFVGKSLDIGYAPIKKLVPRQICERERITAIVDKNISEDEIMRLISKKTIELRGLVCISDNVLYHSNKVSNLLELSTCTQ